MSVMPAHSSTARTGPPAMTPVPVAAGLSSTRPAPCEPTTSCGMVDPVLRQLHHVALGGIHRLAHRLGDLVRLAGGDADPGLAIADRHQGIEREPPAALHHLGDAIDGDDVLDVIAAMLAVAPVAPGTAAARPAHHRRVRGPVGDRPLGPVGRRGRSPVVSARSVTSSRWSSARLPFRTPIRPRARRRRRLARDHGNDNQPDRTRLG